LLPKKEGTNSLVWVKEELIGEKEIAGMQRKKNNLWLAERKNRAPQNGKKNMLNKKGSCRANREKVAG